MAQELLSAGLQSMLEIEEKTVPSSSFGALRRGWYFVTYLARSLTKRSSSTSVRFLIFKLMKLGVIVYAASTYV